MTCNELRLHLENGGPVDAEHLEGCAECRRLVDFQEEAGRHLRLALQTTRDVPGSVDLAVMTAYREYASQRTAPKSVSSLRLRANTSMIRVGFAAVAVMLIAAVVVFFASSSVVRRNGLRSARSSTAEILRQTRPESASEGPAAQPAATKVTVRRHLAIHKSLVTPAVPVATSSLPAGFQSLMYCDPLSCFGTMEIIRMQLPASAVTRGWAAERQDGTVVADVLVGPDGIARAIRIVN